MTHRARTIEELQGRLVLFGISVCRALRTLEPDRITDHFVQQLLRSVTSPAANYAEARAAESRRDFIHKMQISLKELRETDVWLQFVGGLSALDCTTLRAECNELTAIFVASIKTARRNAA